ncbi:MAG: hypothetical protein IJS63_11690 [Bacteroidaceae bacterium]|nr:hypothetical protein [Bacteroidaceae bacterium]
MKSTFTKRVNSVLAAVLTIVALMVGQQALAESKTVTYKFHAVESNNGTNNIVNPVFKGVTISSDDSQMNATTLEGSEDDTQDGISATTINAFRAYFQLNLDGSTDIKESVDIWDEEW